MPRYTYECTEGHAYEKTEGFDAPVQQPCQECEAGARRIPTAPAIVFKGSGFYKTDSRTSSHGRSGASGDGSKPKSDESGEGAKTSESQSAAKADAKPGAKSAKKSDDKSTSVTKS